MTLLKAAVQTLTCLAILGKLVNMLDSPVQTLTYLANLKTLINMLRPLV